MIQNPIPWPNGARCACCDHLRHGRRQPDPHIPARSTAMTGSIPSPWANTARPSPIPRILETYRRLGLSSPSSFPAGASSSIPHAVDAILEGGHEIGHHGYLHEDPTEHTGAEQEYWFDRAFEIHKKATGKRAARLSRAGLQRQPGGHRPADRPGIRL